MRVSDIDKVAPKKQMKTTKAHGGMQSNKKLGKVIKKMASTHEITRQNLSNVMQVKPKLIE